MYLIIQILAMSVWLYQAYQLSHSYFKIRQFAGTSGQHFPVYVALSTAVLFILPIFIGSLIKALF